MGPCDFQTLFQAVPSATLVLDPTLTICAVTDAYLRATMTKREAIVGRGLFDVFPDNPEDPGANGTANLRASLDRVLRSARLDVMAIQKYDIQRPAAQGGGFEARYWSPSNAPVLGKDGKVEYILHCVEDVTEIVQLEQAASEHGRLSEETRARLALIVEHSDDAIISESLDGRITSWNEGAERLFGYAASEVVGRPISVLVPPERTAELNDYFARLKEGKRAIRAETVRRAKDGRLVDVAVTLSAIRNSAGQTVGISKVARDITESKRAEEALRRAKAAADEANAAKSVFLAHMSHEIRTPLNGVVGMIDLLLGTEMSPQQRRYARITKSSAESLTSIINDILDFSKMEAGKLELALVEFQPRAVLEDVLQMLAPPGHHKGLELACWVHPAVPELLVGDPDRFRQVVVNLLNNAIKFTSHGSVVVRATIEGSAGGTYTLRVSVADTGIGIPVERLGRLFKAFSQADALTTRAYGGTGLGLAISKHLTELMGGAIGVSSRAGEGSTFWFTAKFGGSAKVAGTEARVGLPGGVRVLIVDDNATHRQVLREQIAGWGFDCDDVADAAAAVESLAAAMAEGKPFTVAVVNRTLPDKDAFGLAATIRARPDIAGTVMMILVTMDEAIAPQMLSELGFAGAITKPVQQSKLFDTIVTAIARSKPPQAAGDRDAVVEPESPLEGPAAPFAAQPFHRSVRVLLAEDNEVNQIVASELLARMGFACDVVSDGAAAAAAVTREPYDIVLMDCQMPVMDGFDATRAIRRLEVDGKLAGPAGRHIPIVALTANAMKGDRDLCFDAGMDGYASKPIDPDRLQRIIAALVNAASPDEAASSLATTYLPLTTGLPMDYRVAIEWCSGNLAKAAVIIDKFEKQLLEDGEAIRRMTAAMPVNNALSNEVAQTAHRLYGAAAMLAARALCDAASAVEGAARASALDQATDSIKRLQREIDCCLAYLPAARDAVMRGTR